MGWGDELMVTGQVRVMQARDPRKVRVVYERMRRIEAFAHNPRIAQPFEEGDFQVLTPRVNSLRPYMQGKTKERWTWAPYRPPRGELFFSEEEAAFGQAHGGRILIQPTVKPGASPNKDWGRDRWLALIDLATREGIPLAQCAPMPDGVLPGVEWISTPTLRHAAAVVSQARAVVSIEGVFHHLAGAFQIPAAVIYGGFISPAVTGYDGQVAFFPAAGLGCGWRTPCSHCREAMDVILPESVFNALEAMI